MILSSSPPERDEDRCLADVGPSTVVAVVVDASEEFNEVQRQALMDRFYRALSRAAPSDEPSRPVAGEVRVDVYNANAPLGGLIEPVFSQCSTPKLTGLQALAGNPSREEREYEEAFARPLDEAVRGLTTGTSSETSPILESLTAAAERSFAGRDEAQQNSIILISDLLQNSSLVSFYGRQQVPSFESFTSLPGRSSVSPDLKGADLCPIIINRSTENEDRLQTTRLVDWWANYADRMRGRLDMVCIRELQL